MKRRTHSLVFLLAAVCIACSLLMAWAVLRKPVAWLAKEPPSEQEIARQELLFLAVRLRDAGVGRTITPNDETPYMLHLDDLVIFHHDSPAKARVAATEFDGNAFAYRHFTLAGRPPILRRARAALAD